MIIAYLIALLIAILVYKDANSRGMPAFAWSAGVFLLMIVFLPLYFILRKHKLPGEVRPPNSKSINIAQNATIVIILIALAALILFIIILVNLPEILDFFSTGLNNPN